MIGRHPRPHLQVLTRQVPLPENAHSGRKTFVQPTERARTLTKRTGRLR